MAGLGKNCVGHCLFILSNFKKRLNKIFKKDNSIMLMART